MKARNSFLESTEAIPGIVVSAIDDLIRGLVWKIKKVND